MIFNTTFDKIFVINLKESIDRKSHIIQEFKRMNITNYEFFEATHFDDPEVDKLLKSNNVMKFPPCFRCLKKRCSCENNFLTKYQIANWLSFIRLFKHILTTDHNFVCICEDDIAFTKHANKICNQLYSPHTFMKYNINKKAPLLIKMGAAFDYPTHYYFGNASFIKNYSLSNPCFALNKAMIYVFLTNLKIIDYHSDIYFHKTIPQHFGNKIQMFTMKPFPVYELSFVKSIRKFNSLVRPKNQIRRKEYKEFLFVTMNKLLEFIPIQYAQNNHLQLPTHTMGLNGTINHYYYLNDYYKEHYFFEHKYFYYDNIHDDVIFILNQLNTDQENYILNIIEYVKKEYNLDIEIDINNKEQLKKNLYILHPKILDYFKKEGYEIICVETQDDVLLKNKDIYINYNFLKKSMFKKLNV